MLKRLDDKYLNKKKINQTGCIFFIQRWTELTYDKTIDSYQYSVMNTVVALKECFEITNKILDGTYPTLDNLTDSKNELLRLLKDDWIIKKYKEGIYKNLLFMVSKKIESKNESVRISNLKQLRSKLVYQLDIITSEFNNWLKIELIDAVDKCDYNNIDYLANVLVSQCIDLGWSERGLFNIHKFFYNKNESDIEIFKKFLNILFSESDDYSVYIKMTKKEGLEELKNWAERFNIDLDKGKNIVQKYNQDMQKYMGLESETHYLALFTTAKDPVGAALNATEECKKLMELLTFYNKFGPWSPDETVFCTVRNNEFAQVLKSNQIYNTNLYIESSNSIFDDTLKLFTEQDVKFERVQAKLQSVYSYINISKLAKYKEEEFLNMWIGIESFMNTGNYGNIIAHIKHVLPSVMCKRYIYRLIRNLCEDFQRCSVKLTLSSVEIDIEKYDKQDMAKEVISALKDNTLYFEILELTQGNALLEYRVKCIRSLIVDEDKLYNKIIRYSDTVLWHVQRLYRLRNDITHSGYLSENDITPYIEHLHNFTASLIIEVVYVVADESRDLLTVGDILAYLKDTFEAYREKYSISNSVFETGIIELQ